MTGLAPRHDAPTEIPLAPDVAWGVPCLRAPRLVAQQGDADGRLWASRGQWVYMREPGAERFERCFPVPTGPSVHWLRHFASVRRLARYEECIELCLHPDGACCAMSAGAMWHRAAGSASFQRALRLRHYGLGVGGGVAPTGLARLRDGTVLFGEYFQNPKREDVRLYASRDGGRSWRVAHVFAEGEIKHVHVVAQDPLTGDVWVGTGDRDEESRVLRSSDGLKTFEAVGGGGQQWRTLMFLFTPDAVVWGTDTGNEEAAGVYRLDRSSRRVVRLAQVPECFFFGTRLASGSLVMSSDRHGDPMERDDRTRLWLVQNDGRLASLPCGRWCGGRRYATLRLARGVDAPALAVTPLNQHEHDGDLLVLDEAALRDAVG